MEYFTADELTEPGQYWWLPECNRAGSGDPANWSVVSWHPSDPGRAKSGLFYGPLPAPVFTPGIDPKIITFTRTAAEAGVVLAPATTWRELYAQLFGPDEDPADEGLCEQLCRGYVRSVKRNFGVSDQN